MLLRTELVEGPTAPVVSLDEAKAHLRVDGAYEDALIQGYIDAAVQYLDGMGGVLGRALSPQTWQAVFDLSGGDLPLVPVVSQQPPVEESNERRVEFVAGYPNGVPAPIRVAILMHIATLYENRTQDAQSVVPGGAYRELLAPYRRWA